MVILRSRAPENLKILEEQQQQETMEKEDVHAHNISGYERSREERIKENRERMQKLGIFDLSLKLKTLKPAPNRSSHRKTAQGHSLLPLSGPVRRSSRLQNSTPVSYCEVHVPKKDNSLNDDDLLREGSKPEVYTEEHEKLLGGTEMSWTLFVDGYGNDGKRIYDPVRGKTCHQCRQKTLGHRTHCSKCNLVQGQFCGDCLYMRYGENVLEANENPNWICPVCRGICNCSLCRQAKGWPPTGALYRKISSLGYKSVAHYLVQTRRSNTDSDKNVGIVSISAKRSLPFSDVKVTAGEDNFSTSGREYLNTDPLAEADKGFGDGKMAPESGAVPLMEPVLAIQSKDQVECLVKPESKQNGSGYDEEKEANILVHSELDMSGLEPKTAAEPLNDHLLTDSSNYHKGLLISGTLESGDDSQIVLDKKDFVLPETSPKSTKKLVLLETTPDSIAGRLMRRRNKNKTSKELARVNANHTTRNAEDTSSIADLDGTARRLRQRRNKTNTSEKLGLVIANHTTRNAEDTSTIADVDSIARRLKMRRRA